jgi:hypothetical protein
VVDLLGEHAAHHGSPVLERDRRVVGDRGQQRLLLLGERRVAVAHELPDRAPLPAQRQPHRMLTGPPFRPGDLAVLQHERSAGRADRLHRRLDDRLERLLEVERLGHRLRNASERLELGDPSLRVRVELRVLDRLRDLPRDRREQVDLGLRELPRRERPHVEGAGELVSREDRHGEDRLVLVLGQVREGLETLVEVRLGGDHDRGALVGRRPGDALARLHARRPRHLLDARAVRRPQH